MCVVLQQGQLPVQRGHASLSDQKREWKMANCCSSPDDDEPPAASAVDRDEQARERVAAAAEAGVQAHAR